MLSPWSSPFVVDEVKLTSAEYYVSKQARLRRGKDLLMAWSGNQLVSSGLESSSELVAKIKVFRARSWNPMSTWPDLASMQGSRGS
jgi:hypothetical protein